MLRQTLRVVGPVFLVVAAGACEPATITEARQQIARGGLRIVDYVLPVIDTTFQVQNILDSGSVDTTAAGLLAIGVEPESVTVAVGDELQFDNIAFDQFIFSFAPGTFSVGPGTPIPFSGSYAGLASDTVLDVDSIVVHAGTLNLVTQNRIPLDIDYTTTLNGILGPGGTPIVRSGTIPAAPGDGTWVSDVQAIDLAGVKVIPTQVDIQTSGSMTMGSAAIDPALGDSGVIQTGDIPTLSIETVWGPLDPTVTPELILNVEEIEEIPRVDLALDQETEDALRQSTMNSARVALTLENSANAPAELTGFSIGLVKLDATGTVPRDLAGNPVLETDSVGTPIVVPVVDPGQASLNVARVATSSVSLSSAPLVDRLVHLLLDGERVSVVAAGDVVIGDGAPSEVSRSDSVGVTIAAFVVLDITIPDTGIVVTPDNMTEDGLGFDPEDADQLVDRLESATLTAALVNGLPFGVDVDIAFVAGTLPAGTDVFAQPGVVLLNTISVPVPQVDGQGLVTLPAGTTVTIGLTGPEARQLMEEQFTAGLRVRVSPEAGGPRRGAIRATDQILIDTEVRIRLVSGAS